MINALTEMITHEFNLTNNNLNDYDENLVDNNSLPYRLLSRKISDNSSTNNQNQNSHQPSISHHHHEASSLPILRSTKSLSNGPGSNEVEDVYGAARISENTSKHLPNRINNYEFSVIPRQVTQPLVKQSSKQIPVFLQQQRLSSKNPRTNTNSVSKTQNVDNRDEELNNNDEKRRLRLRLSHRALHEITSSRNHGVHDVRSPALSPQIVPIIVNPSINPLKIIFIRHGERINQALGSEWFYKAFRTNTYRPYDSLLPSYLPTRRFYQAYEFDVPLTVRGLKTARLRGYNMMNNNMLPDVCLSSTALRCIQTSERILAGMERRDRIPIRIEPGLFECPHFNHKLVDSFMTKKELIETGYNIKHEYKPLFPKVTVPETLHEYFERSITVMRGIINRYGQYGGTVLIVTHAPGLLALTSAIKGLKPNAETFYRTISSYPPLAMFIAEYDGKKWKYLDQPFNLVAHRE